MERKTTIIRSKIGPSPTVRLLLVVAAVTANTLLFYVLAVARSEPALPIVPADQPRLYAVDLPDVRPPETQTQRARQQRPRRPEQLPVVAAEPVRDMAVSLEPRLSSRFFDIAPAPRGISVSMPAQSDLLRAQAPPTGEAPEQLSVLEVDEIPVRISGAPPRYPQWARRARAEAVVTLRFVVTATGEVEQVRIHDIEGDQRLGEEAVRTVRNWRFRPAIQAGNPVACWCFQKVNFQLRD